MHNLSSASTFVLSFLPLLRAKWAAGIKLWVPLVSACGCTYQLLNFGYLQMQPAGDVYTCGLLKT